MKALLTLLDWTGAAAIGLAVAVLGLGGLLLWPFARLHQEGCRLVWCCWRENQPSRNQ